MENGWLKFHQLTREQKQAVRADRSLWSAGSPPRRDRLDRWLYRPEADGDITVRDDYLLSSVFGL